MEQYTLKKEFKFEAAHELPHHDGKCKRLHGHSWVGRVVLRGNKLNTTGPKQGMLFDYAEVGAVVKPLVETYLDHHYLNKTLQMENPTSENIARWIFQQLKPELPILVAVEIDETCTSSCCYEEKSGATE